MTVRQGQPQFLHKFSSWRAVFAAKDVAILILCAIGWFGVSELILAPTFGEADTYFFMDAGVNLALGKGLTSLMTFGNPTFTPKILTHYPPIYSLTFGLFSWLFGIGPRQDDIYNFLIAATTAMLAYVLLRRQKQDDAFIRSDWLTLALACCAVPMGFYGTTVDRPDAMGLSAAFAALLVLSGSTTLSRYFFAFVLAGLAFEISPVCGLLAALGLAILWFASAGRATLPLSRLLPLAIAGGALFPVSIQAILAAFDPTTAARFAGVFFGQEAAGPFTGSGYLLMLLHGEIGNYLSAFSIGAFEHVADYAKLAIVCVMILTYSIWRFVATRSRHELGAYLLLVALGLLPVFLVPYQKLYAAIAAGFVLVLFSIVNSAADIVPRRAGRFAVAMAFLGIVAFNAPTLAKSIIERSFSGPSLARMTAALARLKNEPAFKNQIVAASPESYFLFKQLGFDVITWYVPFLPDPRLEKQIPLYSFAYTGTGNPLQHQQPDWWRAEDYELLYKPRLPQIPTLFGIPLSHSSLTWEVAIYRRRGTTDQ